jgi:hypothetical protein
MNIDMGMFAKGLAGFPCVCFSLIRLMNGFLVEISMFGGCGWGRWQKLWICLVENSTQLYQKPINVGLNSFKYRDGLYI